MDEKQDKNEKLDELAELMTQTTTLYKDSIHSHTIAPGAITTGSMNTYPYQPSHTFAPTYQTYQTQPYIPVAPEPQPIPGLADLCAMLDVEPSEEGWTIQAEDGTKFNLIEVLSAQVEIMTKLHFLLVHRKLTPEGS